MKQLMPWAMIFWTLACIFARSADSMAATLSRESTLTREP